MVEITLLSFMGASFMLHVNIACVVFLEAVYNHQSNALL